MIYQVKNWKTWDDKLGRSPSQVASDHQDYYNINKNLKIKVVEVLILLIPVAIHTYQYVQHILMVSNLSAEVVSHVGFDSLLRFCEPGRFEMIEILWIP